ncbi:RibD family protein, partial [Microbacterium sp. CPCC 204701]|uniref:RibD family protein n=1 Tax=Microbacterium sp. CPCC 204701 TaxID=2493084 RepID=UPI0013E3615F
RADVHRRRAHSDAIVVGTGTVLADDPALTARAPDGSLLAQQPVPVVLGTREVPGGAAVHRHPRPILQYAGDDLRAVLEDLGIRGVQRVFVEGGPTVAASFVREGLADELLVYVAPMLLGGDMLALRDIGVPTIAQARRLAVASVETLGDDLLIVATPVRETASAGSPRSSAAHGRQEGEG